MLLLIAAAVIVYANSFSVPFHFDDHQSIVENYQIHRFDVQEIFRTSLRPVLDLTFAANYAVNRLNVFGYHLVNLLLHAANGLLLYGILFRTVGASAAAGREGGAGYVSGWTGSVPLYASLIFLVHPVQTQAVTYIVSRSSVLATFFFLLSLFLFIAAFRPDGGGLTGRIGSRGLLAASVASSCLAMGSKQEAATLPAVILLYDYFFVAAGRTDELKKRLALHVLFFLTVGIAVWLSLSGLSSAVTFDYGRGAEMPRATQLTSWEYFLTQLHVIPFYLRLLFLPVNQNLDYDWPVTRSFDPATGALFMFLIGLIAVGIGLFRKDRLVSFGILWFFVTLSVTSSFFVIYDVIFEHRLYLPSIGFAICLAVFLARTTAGAWSAAGAYERGDAGR